MLEPNQTQGTLWLSLAKRKEVITSELEVITSELRCHVSQEMLYLPMTWKSIARGETLITEQL